MLAGLDKTILRYKLTGPMLTATEMGWGGLGLGKERSPLPVGELKCLDP